MGTTWEASGNAKIGAFFQSNIAFKTPSFKKKFALNHPFPKCDFCDFCDL